MDNDHVFSLRCFQLVEALESAGLFSGPRIRAAFLSLPRGSSPRSSATMIH